jgi:hypothetical protein
MKFQAKQIFDIISESDKNARKKSQDSLGKTNYLIVQNASQSKKIISFSKPEI